MIKLIKTVADKTSKEVQVKYVDNVGTGPVELVSFFFKYYHKLLDDGLGSPWMSMHNGCHAVYVEIDGKIVGHIIFDVFPAQDRTWIVLSAVDEDYRGRGLYKILHEEFEKITKQLGCSQITSFVHVNNIARLKSAESVGFYPQFYRMHKQL